MLWCSGAGATLVPPAGQDGALVVKLLVHDLVGHFEQGFVQVGQKAGYWTRRCTRSPRAPLLPSGKAGAGDDDACLGAAAFGEQDVDGGAEGGGSDPPPARTRNTLTGMTGAGWPPGEQRGAGLGEIVFPVRSPSGAGLPPWSEILSSSPGSMAGGVGDGQLPFGRVRQPCLSQSLQRVSVKSPARRRSDRFPALAAADASAVRQAPHMVVRL